MFVEHKNNRTRSVNLLNLSSLQPSLFPLADKLGMKLHWRDGEAWGNDVQLTYRMREIDGKSVTLDEAGRAECAMYVMGLIAEARESWGTLVDRANAIIDEFIAERIPHGLKQMTFLVAQNNSLDSCSAFGGGLSGALNRGIEVTVSLIGEDQVRGKGDSLIEAAESARLACIKEFTDKEPSGLATAPFDGEAELAEIHNLMGIKDTP